MLRLLITNQLTYRGYFYDFETGLYYLQSRYYSPGWSRFINADKHFDTQDGILGTNMFIYCHNNPVSRVDPNGEDSSTILKQLDITISPNPVTVEKGKSVTIKLAKATYYEQLTDNLGSIKNQKDVTGSINDKDVSWCDNDEAIATRSSNTGKTITITGVSVGTTSIRVRAQYDKGILYSAVNSQTMTISINVVNPTVKVTGVSLNTTSKTMEFDSTFDLTATVSPSNATNNAVSWSVSNDAVSLSSTGNVKKVTVTAKKSGSATITVKTSDGGKVATCTVNVKIPMPVKGATFRTNPYDFPNYEEGEFHGGTDFAKAEGAPAGSKIIAVFGGTVYERTQSTTSYGNHVRIDCVVNGVTYRFIYAHMSSIAIGVNVKEVKQGQLLGYVGNTGNSTGPHLHFEVRKSPYGFNATDCINPKSFY